MEVEEIEFPSRDEFVRWYEELKNKEKILIVSSSYDETESIMRITIITQDKHYKVSYPIFLSDFFPEFETEEELAEILKDIQSMARDKIIVDKPFHPTALAMKLMELIEHFRFVGSVRDLNERTFKLLLGLLLVLKDSIDTWISAMEREIRGAFLSHIIKRQRENKA